MPAKGVSRIVIDGQVSHVCGVSRPSWWGGLLASVVLVGACARAGDGDTSLIDAGGASKGQDSGAVSSSGASSGDTPPPGSSSGDDGVVTGDDGVVTDDGSTPVTGDDGNFVIPVGDDDATVGDDASGGDDAGASCAETCTNGCCDSTGTCVRGSDDGECGSRGVACQDCTSAGLTCQSKACFAAPGGDSGGGGSTCNASSCPSCIPYFVPCCKSNDTCGCSLLFPPGACN